MTIIRLNSATFPLTTEERAIYGRTGIRMLETEVLDKHEHGSWIKQADALAVVSAKVTDDMIKQMSNLRVISRYGSGTDNIDIEAANLQGAIVTNVPEFCLP
jgi:D-3-phosphoglycerate dehydrogenase